MKTTIETFLQKLSDNPELIEFADTMSVIDECFYFIETSFRNGEINNEAGQNSGSCKLFAFAQLQSLTKEQTLACFGSYYRDEVLKNPQDANHQNIRQFMKNGFSGVSFPTIPLQLKN